MLQSIVQHIRDRFDIREVLDGEAAWQAILLDSSIRVVITDLTMPKVDGFELLNRVRSSKVQSIRELPVVVISGEDEGAERDRAATMGATDFIQKGVAAAELIARLEVLVRLSATEKPWLKARHRSNPPVRSTVRPNCSTCRVSTNRSKSSFRSPAATSRTWR